MKGLGFYVFFTLTKSSQCSGAIDALLLHNLIIMKTEEKKSMIVYIIAWCIIFALWFATFKIWDFENAVLIGIAALMAQLSLNNVHKFKK